MKNKCPGWLSLCRVLINRMVGCGEYAHHKIWLVDPGVASLGVGGNLLTHKKLAATTKLCLEKQ
jgi:hypothetical protein